MVGLVGDSSCLLLARHFQVERPSQQIEFICQLRASAVQAGFDLDWLRVVRVGE